MNLDIRLFRRAVDSRQGLFLTIGFGVAATAMAVIQAALFSRTINQVFLLSQPLQEVTSTMGLLLVIFLLRAIFIWGSEFSAGILSIKIKSSLREQLFQHILSVGPVRIQNEKTGELNSTMTEGIEAIEIYFSQYLPALVMAALIPLLILLIVLPLDTLSGMILLLTAPLIPLFMFLIANLVKTMTQKQWQTLGRMSAYLLDVLQGLETLKIFGRSIEQVRTIADVSDRFRRQTMDVLRVAFLSALALEMIATLSTAIVAVEVSLRLLYGQLDFELALFVLLLAPEFYLSLRTLGARFHTSMPGITAANRVFEILAIPPVLIINPQSQAGVEKESLRFSEGIQFDNVHFKYQDGRAALKGVSFAIKPGSRVAFVGPSSGGKTTIALLLLRFVSPDQGQIFIGTKSLQQICVEAWLSDISWIPQTPYLFFDSVLANILLAKPDASMEQVIYAARLAEADEFISQLPQGYQTVIGERGYRLSGGQAQRIALARAFLKDSSIIILDEATANLDPDTEASIQVSLSHLLENRTVIIIAHRLNTVMDADQVILLEDGRVVDFGSPIELTQREGLFRKLLEPISPGFVERNETMQDSTEPSIEKPVVLTPADESRYQATTWKSMPVFLRLMGLLESYRGLVFVSLILGCATVLSGVGLMSTSVYLLSAAALHPSIAELQVAIVGVRFFGIARGVFRYLERYYSHQVTFKLIARLRVLFYSALEPLAPARLMQYRSSDLMARIIADIQDLESFYVRSLFPLIVAVVVSSSVFVMLYLFSPELGWIWLPFVVVAGIFLPLGVRKANQHLNQRVVSERSDLYRVILDGIQGLPDLLAFNMGKIQITNLKNLSNKQAETQKSLAAIQGGTIAMGYLVANLAMWAVVWIAIDLVSDGVLPGVYLATVGMIALTGFEAITPLAQAAQSTERNLISAERLSEIVNTSPEVVDHEHVSNLPEGFHLQIKNLCFRYPEPALEHKSPNKTEVERKWTLDHICIDLKPGMKIAILGPSGSGKSTILAILLRFWEYQEGEILLEGQDIRGFKAADIRNMMGVVPQRTYIFSASLRDNLRISLPHADEFDLLRALRTAQLERLIKTLPDGFNTWVGEQGLRLSGGERQRLMIARALLKNAPVLLLDEPTSNLDNINASIILSAIIGSNSGNSVIVVTHRAIALEMVDEILVLDQGRIIERGTHQELLAACGTYAKTCKLERQILPDHEVENR